MESLILFYYILEMEILILFLMFLGVDHCTHVSAQLKYLYSLKFEKAMSVVTSQQLIFFSWIQDSKKIFLEIKEPL